MLKNKAPGDSIRVTHTLYGMEYCSPENRKQLNLFNPLAHGRCGRNDNSVILQLTKENSSFGTQVKLLSGECQRAPLMWSQHRFSYWHGSIRQQAITWSSVVPDLCCYMVSLGHNDLTNHIKNHNQWNKECLVHNLNLSHIGQNGSKITQR